MIREEHMLGYSVGFEFTGDALFEIVSDLVAPSPG